jgi:ABC-type ATPase involved in cell division
MGHAYAFVGVSKGPLQDVSLHGDHGETVIVGGARGTGKHLILRLLLGLEKPTSGTVRVLGKDLQRLSIVERRQLRVPVGLVPIEGPMLSNLSVFDNVALPLRYHLGLSEAEVDARVRRALAQMGLEQLANRRPWQVSMPQRRLASLARARLMRPEILLLEDPYGGMDARDAQHISRVVRDVVSSGCAVLMTTMDQGVETLRGGPMADLPKIRFVSRGAP